MSMNPETVDQDPAEGQPQDSAGSDPEPNLRVEEMIRRFVRKRKVPLLVALAGLVVIAAGVFWVRSGDAAPIEPVQPPPPTIDVVAVVQATLTAQAAASQPAFDSKDIEQLVNDRVANLDATRTAHAALRPTSPPPAMLPAKATAYTRYRYYHFLEEYRQCFTDRVHLSTESTPEPTPTPEPESTPEPAPDATPDTAQTGDGGPGSDVADRTLEPTPTPTPTPLRSEYDLEIETLRALPEAVAALLAMYDLGECEEPDDYAIYKGRGTWLRLWR